MISKTNFTKYRVLLRFDQKDLNVKTFSTAFKRGKNCHKGKSFYFWQTISKRPHLIELAFKKATWQSLGEIQITYCCRTL